jgi:ATP-dependent Lhr-like helicase
VVRGRVDKTLLVDTLLPHEPGRFSWGGHLGAQMLQPVAEEIERSAGTTLVFTNVRSQAETWYQLLLNARPDWAGLIALHHGSLDKEVRAWVEAGLKTGSLKAVVATSSLDLGVDFLPVERVLQIGSAKGVARLLQRAGRSGHQPGRASRVTLVPTNTLELVEAVAARRAALAGRVESREPPDAPLDVLVQHLVSIALGGGFAADALFREVRGAFSYRRLTRDAFDWALGFVVHGGDSLRAYPEYHRVVLQDGRYRVPDRGIALRHRLQVGTIVADAAMQVKWLSGGTLGSIEESFIARLKPGDCFVFGGRVLEYVRTQDMAAYVRKATAKRGIVPAWSGGRMPLSSELADATLAVLDGCRQGDWLDPELQCAQPMLQAQMRLSKLPTPRTLLVERHRSREGWHLFIYPFAGRLVHLGLASLLAWRLAHAQPNTFSLSVNDYGFELLGAAPLDDALDWHALFDDAELLRDVLASLNSGELAQRRFREIARIAGLVFSGYPGAPKSTRQLQASSSLFYEVFRKYDPANRLLGQAEGEVLSQELELKRLRSALQRMRRLRVDLVDLRVPSPFSLPLMVERFREQLSTEKLTDRLARMLAEAEQVLSAPSSRARRRAGAARNAASVTTRRGGDDAESVR